MRPPANVVFVVGTGMNSGKTTTAAALVKALLMQGLRVVACKLTGSVSHRDAFEYMATGAHEVWDFSDYGFPSTYLCSKDELRSLFWAMLDDAARNLPDIVVIEIADGVLQRETQLILADVDIRRHINGVVLTAPCSASALQGVAQLKAHGHQVMAVSGIITNSPLFMREITCYDDVPVASSKTPANELAALIMPHVEVNA